MAIIQPLLSVRNVAESITFYSSYLGFQLEGEPLPGNDGRPVFAAMRHGPTLLSLDNTEYHELPPDAPHGVGVDLYVSLDKDVDIDALHERMQREGVKIVEPIRDQFWGDRRFVIHDPDGYRLSVAKNMRGVSHDEMSEHTRKGS